MATKSNSYASRPGSFFEVATPDHNFGGKWTSEKLERLARYLTAYVTALKKQTFAKIYVDAFAGSGDVKLFSTDNFSCPIAPLFPELQDEGTERFIEGSARIALGVAPPFNRYIFIENKSAHVRDLEKLRSQFPDRANSISVIRGDANEQLCRICDNTDWKKNRAVFFLDPYGMQVKWSTIEKIAETGAIDLWYLFPLGIGVSRLLKNDGVISESHQLKLDEIFGTKLWRSSFYREGDQQSLFPEEESLVKAATLIDIEKFFLSRLKTAFPHVANKPYRMLNAKGNILYSLCFAAGNKGAGGELALKIANHILKG